jgi:hypothetical protein
MFLPTYQYKSKNVYNTEMGIRIEVEIKGCGMTQNEVVQPGVTGWQEERKGLVRN